jgi:hypothetical protein
MAKTEEFLIETADQCVRLARAGRELADSLKAMSEKLMAKAVELDTTRDRDDGSRSSGGRETPSS